MKYFGPRYAKLIGPPGPRDKELGIDRLLVDTPAGQPCAYCDKPIAAADSGMVLPYVHGTAEQPALGVSIFHLVCFAKSLGLTEHAKQLEGEN